ncbi:MAG: hypothetical protein K8R21_12070 [Leptospira sp.]|nr:hypothetical protein [Leptospira sp.]
MRIERPNDKELINSAEKYYKSGNPDEFARVGGLWVVAYAKARFRLVDDMVSDLFLIFHGKAEHCLKTYRDKEYKYFPAFLNVYAKHLTLNLFRTSRQKNSDEYLSLWDEDRARPEHRIEWEDNLHSLKQEMGYLQPIDRIALSLKFNIDLSRKDFEFLGKVFSERDICIHSFMEYHFRKIEEIKLRKASLLAALNACNRKIFLNTGKDIDSSQRRKNLIIRKIEKMNNLYSLKELSRILGIPRFRMRKLIENSLTTIRGGIMEKFAA